MISRALKMIRVFHEIPQKDLAEKLGISASFLSEIEKGHKQPSLDLLQKYAATFDMPLSSIVLFAEQVGDAKSPKAKWISSKILSLLEFVDARAGTDKN